MTATEDEAHEAAMADAIKRSGGEGIPGYIDPLFSFLPPEQLTEEQAVELQRLKSGAAEYYGYTIEQLTG